MYKTGPILLKKKRYMKFVGGGAFSAEGVLGQRTPVGMNENRVWRGGGSV